ncbi:MAG: site-specific integrase [Campylobacterota bacterium]|nr:site-specific integrase [Campylobacterota bacterium]
MSDSNKEFVGQSKITLNTAFDDYIKSISHKPDTRNSRGRYKNNIKEHLGTKKLIEITVKDILDLKILLSKKVSLKTKRILAPKTVDDMINLIHTIYKYHNKYYEVEIKSPASPIKVERYNPDNARQRYLTLDEVKSLMWHIRERNSFTTHRNSKPSVTADLLIFTKLSLSTGARVSSILTIRVKDIDFESGIISIVNHKSNRNYKGYINKQLSDELLIWTENLSSETYVVGRKSTALARSTINRRLQVVLDRAFNEGVTDRREKVVTHTLRHTFGSLLAIQGTPLYTVMKLLDHTSVGQTMVYAKLAPNQGKDEVMKLSYE